MKMKMILPCLVITLLVSQGFCETPTNSSIGWEGGISFRNFTANNTGIQIILGLFMEFPDETALNNEVDIYLEGNLLRLIWEGDNSNVWGFVGLALFRDDSVFPNVDSQTDVSILLGIHPEYFVTPRISIGVKTGIALTFEGGDNGSRFFETFGSFLGGASVNWYF